MTKTGLLTPCSNCKNTRLPSHHPQFLRHSCPWGGLHVSCVCPCGSVMVPAELVSLVLESPSGLSKSQRRLSAHCLLSAAPSTTLTSIVTVGFGMSCQLPFGLTVQSVAPFLQLCRWKGQKKRGWLALPGMWGDSETDWWKLPLCGRVPPTHPGLELEALQLSER